MKEEIVAGVDAALSGIRHGSVSLRLFIGDGSIRRYEIERVVSYMGGAAKKESSGLFSVKKAADFLGVAEITVRRKVSDGSLKHVRIGKRILFRPDDLRDV